MGGRADIFGVGIALLVIGGWAGHLIYCLTSVPVVSPWVPLHLWVQTFLSVGLFITAHDAMHGSVAPGSRRLNHAIGALAVFLYAGFLYRELFRNHWAHHRAPVSDTDPDYGPLRGTTGERERFWPWAFAFVARYYGWKNFALMHLHIGAFWLIGGSLAGVILFFGVPAWASALQLFYFGTYRPHRTPPGGHSHPDRAVSDRMPVWLSFLTCYHFGGYHEEHHENPATPWWALPGLRRLRAQS